MAGVHGVYQIGHSGVSNSPYKVITRSKSVVANGERAKTLTSWAEPQSSRSNLNANEWEESRANPETVPSYQPIEATLSKVDSMGDGNVAPKKMSTSIILPLAHITAHTRWPGTTQSPPASQG